jgi:hypothetical protein
MTHDILTIIGIVFFVIAIIGIVIIFLPVWGQDVDPCFVDNDMYKRICDQQEIDKILNSLLERAREWNSK